MPLDELVGAPPTGDPRVRPKPIVMGGRTHCPSPASPAACRRTRSSTPAQAGAGSATHEGYEWLYVLSGKLRLVLGEHDVVLTAGEAAEFDTRVPHWFGSTGDGPVEFLSLFGPQGERMHVRARPKGA